MSIGLLGFCEESPIRLIGRCEAVPVKLRVLSSISDACCISARKSGNPGDVYVSDGRFFVSCGKNSALELLTLQLEGSKKMSAGEMLRGKLRGMDLKVEA